jgi:hypothetical protein
LDLIGILKSKVKVQGMDKSILLFILTAAVAICVGVFCVLYVMSSFTIEHLEEEIEDEQVNKFSE